MKVSVSIPIGFSSSLQLKCSDLGQSTTWSVSIPIGFSSSLQHAGQSGICHVAWQFQSLSGFQVRCNMLGYYHAMLALYTVSIPIGFSSSLQPSVKCERRSVEHEFQSLSGFQVRCNAVCGSSDAETSDCGFNPYRVFKFVATAPFEWLFLAIILSKSQKLRPPGMNLFRTRPL